MLKIDNLTLRLPPEFAGRERAFGMAVVQALADIPVTGDLTIKSLSQSIAAPSPLSGNEAIAGQIAANIHRSLDAANPTHRKTGRVQWQK